MTNAYGMIKWKQTGMGFETFGLDLGNPILLNMQSLMEQLDTDQHQ